MPRVYRRYHRVRMVAYLKADQAEWLRRTAGRNSEFKDRSELMRWVVDAGITAYRASTDPQPER